MGPKIGPKNGPKIGTSGIARGRKPGGGAYLNRKGGIYYYRYVFPRNSVWSTHARELRVSLKTGYLGQAQRLASRLHELTVDFLERFVMCNDDSPEAQKARLDSQRTQLRQMVDEILDEPDKRAVSIEAARKKLNGYLKRKLDENAARPMPLPTSTITHPDNRTEPIAIDSIYERNTSEIVQKINTFDDFEDWYPQSVMEMISENIFNREEISKENSIQLAKLFQKTLAIYNQIKAARIRGDYCFEQPFYSAVDDLNGLDSVVI